MLHIAVSVDLQVIDIAVKWTQHEHVYAGAGGQSVTVS